MRILGIDPGIARTGWGIIEAQSAILRRSSGQEFKVHSYGCIETPAGMVIEKRLKLLYRELQTIITKEQPQALGIEELFFNTNAKTAFVVGQARGVVLLTAAQNNMPVGVYTPLQVKIAVTGYGRAEKKQVGHMVKTLLQLPAVPKPDDTADALAIALTHAFSAKLTQAQKNK